MPYLQNVTIIIFSTTFPNQTHAEALAAHQAAENAVRAAAGQVFTIFVGLDHRDDYDEN